MKKILFILFITSIVLSGCVTQNKCYNKYPPKIIVRDSIVPKLIYVPVHDSIPIYFPPDTIRDSISVPCKNGKAEDVDLTKENDYTKAHAYTKSGKMYLDLIQKDTTINRMFNDSVQAYIDEHFHFEQVKPQEIIKWKTHWYDKATRNIVGGELIILIIFLLIKYGKSILKFITKLLIL